MHYHGSRSYLHPRYCKVNVGTNYSKDKELISCVPQGSCAGPILFTVYASTIESVITTQTSDNGEESSSQIKINHPNDRATTVSFQGFADDHALKNTFSANSRLAERESVSTLEAKVADVKLWMDHNCLKMNDSKTKFIMFASRQMLQKCVATAWDVNGLDIQ